MHQALHNIVRDWDEEDCDDAGCHHAAEDGETKENSSVCSGSRSEYKGYDAEDEREGRHKNRPESHLGPSEGGLRDGFSSLKLDFRKLYDEDRVLGG